MSTLLPQAFWFRMALPCRRIAVPTKGGVLELPESCALPDFGELEGRPSWVSVRAGWNPSGLGLSFEVTGKVGKITHDPTGLQPSDGVRVWLDTRDTRDVHRATRFCRRIDAAIVPPPRGTKGDLETVITSPKIARAVADPPMCDPSSIASRASTIRKGWRLELFIPAAVMPGFDAETNRRLGFAYQAIDPDRGDTFLGVGREFPLGEDPSLWSTLELVD